jgi:hypothetical protein
VQLHPDTVAELLDGEKRADILKANGLPEDDKSLEVKLIGWMTSPIAEGGGASEREERKIQLHDNLMLVQKDNGCFEMQNKDGKPIMASHETDDLVTVADYDVFASSAKEGVVQREDQAVLNYDSNPSGRYHDTLFRQPVKAAMSQGSFTVTREESVFGGSVTWRINTQDDGVFDLPDECVDACSRYYAVDEEGALKSPDIEKKNAFVDSLLPIIRKGGLGPKIKAQCESDAQATGNTSKEDKAQLIKYNNRCMFYDVAAGNKRGHFFAHGMDGNGTSFHGSDTANPFADSSGNDYTVFTPVSCKVKTAMAKNTTVLIGQWKALQAENYSLHTTNIPLLDAGFTAHRASVLERRKSIAFKPMRRGAIFKRSASMMEALAEHGDRLPIKSRPSMLRAASVPAEKSQKQGVEKRPKPKAI